MTTTPAFVGTRYGDVRAAAEAAGIVFVRIVHYADDWKQGNPLPSAWDGLHAWAIAKADWYKIADLVGDLEEVIVDDDAMIMALNFNEVDEYVTGQDRGKKLLWGIHTPLSAPPALPTPWPWTLSDTLGVHNHAGPEEGWSDYRLCNQVQVIIRQG